MKTVFYKIALALCCVTACSADELDPSPPGQDLDGSNQVDMPPPFKMEMGPDDGVSHDMPAAGDAIGAWGWGHGVGHADGRERHEA